MKGFCHQGTYKEQGQRTVNIPTIMTFGEMLEYWGKVGGEHLKGKGGSSWRVRVLGRMKWEGRASQSWAPLTCMLVKELVVVEEQGKKGTAAQRAGREFRKSIWSTPWKVVTPPDCGINERCSG